MVRRVLHLLPLNRINTVLHNMECHNQVLLLHPLFRVLLHSSSLPSSQVDILDQRMGTLNLLNPPPLPVLTRIGVF
jgi:hypothetical protein